MKNILYYILLPITLICVMNGCSKNSLNSPPANLLANDLFYKTPAQSEQGIVGIYSLLRDIHREEFLFMSECRSDNFWVNPTPSGLREYSEIGTFRAGIDLAQFSNVWNVWYSVVNNSNVAIDKIAAVDFGTSTILKNQLLGEAHFLRGWAYFELARLFGNVPIIDRPMSPNEVASVKQSPASDVFENIIVPDLRKAVDLLPNRNDMKSSSGSSIAGQGRADKIASRAMLARVYMTMSGYPLRDASKKAMAEEELKAVIDYSEGNGNKYWAPDFLEWQKQWMSEYNNKYSIFAIQYRSGGRGNNAIFFYSYGVPLSITSFGMYGNEIYCEKSLMFEFSKIQSSSGSVDRRGIGHSVLTGYQAEGSWPTYSNTLDTFRTDNGDVVDVLTKSIVYKYLNSLKKRAELGFTTNLETSMQNGQDWPVNFPVIRYEDVLLMYAEILVEKGQLSNSLAIVNRIRKRVGCDELSITDRDKILAAIKNERRIEFFGEGVRWFDIVRWGEWKQIISTKFGRYNNPLGTSQANLIEGRYLFPIPLSQMNINNGFYIQNTGY